MDTKHSEYSIEQLDRVLEASPGDVRALLLRGKLHQREGRFDLAYNDFAQLLAIDPDNTEAQQLLSLLREIFAFRYTDLYNP